MSSDGEDKLFPLKEDGEVVGYLFYCPGCDDFHRFDVGEGMHSFDGDIESPSVSPSLLCEWDPETDGFYRRCHLYLRKGRLMYLRDCTHRLAGKSMNLPPLPEDWQ